MRLPSAPLPVSTGLRLEYFLRSLAFAVLVTGPSAQAQFPFLKLPAADDSPAVYWVSPEGTASWKDSRSEAPLSGSSACSLAIANRNARPGDLVLLREGTYRTPIQPNSNGTPTQPVIYTAHENESPLITGIPTGILLDQRSYITIEGIRIEETDEFVELISSHHITITRCVFTNANNTDGWPIGVDIRDGSHHNRLTGNRIGKCGYSDDDDRGGLINIGRENDETNYNLIENNVLYHGGHHVMEVFGSFNVIRRNHFHNEEWMNDGQFGNRLLIVDGPGDRGWNLIEENTFASSGKPVDADGVAGVQLRSPQNIIRRNLFYDNDEAGLNVSSPSYHSTLSPPGSSADNRIYHNVMFRNGFAVKETYLPFLSGLSLNQYGSGPSIKRIHILNNIFWQNRDQRAISFSGLSKRSNQIIRHNWEENGNPLFRNDKGPIDPARPECLDLRLREGSPCIDAGGFLTRTNSAGTGTVFPVEDAGFFTTGWGIVSGDLIQLEGETEPLRTISIDYVRNRIEVDRTITWTEGQGVALAYRGSAPDIGAFEY